MNLKNWETQLRKGLLEIVVLNLLHHNPLHGYEIVQILKRNRKLEILQIRKGNIYAILSRLQANGLIVSSFESSKEGPPKNLLTLTELGQSTLVKMNTHLDKMYECIQRVRAKKCKV